MHPKYSQLRKSLVAMSVVLALGGCSEQPASSSTVKAPTEQAKAGSQAEADNPFYKTYSTRFEVPPFHLIKDEHYMPAFEKGMKDHLAEIDAIVNNPDAPTFENTVEALERSGKLLSKVQRVFYNLAGSNTNSTLQKIQRDMSPVLSAPWRQDQSQ